MVRQKGAGLMLFIMSAMVIVCLISKETNDDPYSCVSEQLQKIKMWLVHQKVGKNTQDGSQGAKMRSRGTNFRGDEG